MKRILLSIIFILGISGINNAQILGVNKPLFSDLPFFNTKFIKANSVKSITGSISSKKVRDIIRSKGLDYHYEFGKDGKLKTQLSSHFSRGLKDTATHHYTYDTLGRIAVKRQSDLNGYCSYHYNYDKLNNIITQSYCRDENKLDSKKEFELKKQYVITTDSFTYVKLSDTQTQKTFYNDYGIKFKTQTNYYDSLGYLIEEYSKFVIGNNKKKTTYEYDEIGRIFKKNTYINIAKNTKNTEVYNYDEIGNILDIKYYNTDKHTSTKQFLYDKKTMLLSAMIIQDLDTEFLRIIKYRYTFFDGSTNYSEIDSLGSPNTK